MSGSLRILLTVVLFAGATAGVVFGVVKPMREQMKGDRAAIAERRTQLTKLGRVARRITDLQAEIERLEEALAFFENRLPEQREIEVILREVWLIAEARTLSPRSIRTKKPIELPRCNSQPISLTLEGPFEGFYDFLLGLERLPRITKVREMQIQRSSAGDGLVQVDLLMDIFFEKTQ